MQRKSFPRGQILILFDSGALSDDMSTATESPGVSSRHRVTGRERVRADQEQFESYLRSSEEQCSPLSLVQLQRGSALIGRECCLC